MSDSPVIFDQFGREAANSWVYQGGRWGGRERRNVFVIAEDSRNAIDKYTRENTLALARWLVANQGRIRGPLYDLTRYSIGSGLIPQSLAQDDGAADEYEAYFADWALRCHAAKRFTYWEMQKILSRAIDCDGDIGKHTVINGRNADPLIQLIESHRISSDGVEDSGDAGAGWHDGVQTDAYGGPVNYRIREGDNEYRTVSADYFRLLMDPDRCDQTRGLSALSFAIENSFDSDDILTFSKIGIKMRESIGFVVYTENGAQDTGLGHIESGNSAAENGGVALDTMQAGMIPRLKINERVQDIGSQRPNPAFAGFLDYLIRDYAVGLGLPYEFVWNPAGATGPAQRFVLEKAQRRFEERQELFTKEIQYDWNLVIGRAIARKELRPDKWWRRIDVQCPAKITVDVGREAQQNREDLKFGNRTMSEDLGERGRDWKATQDQQDREIDRLLDKVQAQASKRGIPLELALMLYRQQSANPQIPPPAAADKSAPPSNE